MGEREVYFYVGGKMREREERKERFSREKENGREKFPFAAAPDFGAKTEDLSLSISECKDASPNSAGTVVQSASRRRFKFALPVALFPRRLPIKRKRS